MEKSKKELKNNEFYLTKWFDGKLSDEALKQYVSEDDITVYKKLKAGLALYEKLESPVEPSFIKIKERIETKKKKSRFKYWQTGIAAAAVIAVFFTTLFIDAFNKTSYSTTFAEHKNIRLPDDSEVILNAKSVVTYNTKTWNNNREVYLDGEAYFKVTKGSNFTVKTNNGSVLVLGTQFNVNAYNDYFQVSCYEGKVQVSSDTKTTVLAPMQSVREINKTQEQWTFNASKPTWVAGESSFRSVPLSYVIAALERQYDLKFDASKIDETVLFTGSFSHTDLSLALTTVFKTMQISYQEKQNKIIQLSK